MDILWKLFLTAGNGGGKRGGGSDGGDVECTELSSESIILFKLFLV